MTVHAVVVGASLAGLRGAEAMRRAGFAGRLTLVGEEPHAPYDRPPLSKRVLAGDLPADGSTLPVLARLDAEWRLGRRAAGLDLARRVLALDDGATLAFDHLLIATGSKARPWPNGAEAAHPRLFTLRGRDDAARLRAALAEDPARVLVIGAGFIGCEVASACRELGLPVTLVDPNPTPLARVMGAVLGGVVAANARAAGVDLRMERTVERLGPAPDGGLRALLSDGSTVAAGVVVVALGAVRDTGWLRGSSLAADANGIAADGFCRALDEGGRAIDGVAVAGDVARWPHPLYGDRAIALEHWGNAVEQAGFAAETLLRGPAGRAPYAYLPAFWSAQFGVNIKSVGLVDGADQLVIAQGSLAERRFVAVLGRAGRTVAAVSFDSARWLPAYAEQVSAGAPCPPIRGATDQGRLAAWDPAFPARRPAVRDSGQIDGGPHG